MRTSTLETKIRKVIHEAGFDESVLTPETIQKIADEVNAKLKK